MRVCSCSNNRYSHSKIMLLQNKSQHFIYKIILFFDLKFFNCIKIYIHKHHMCIKYTVEKNPMCIVPYMCHVLQQYNIVLMFKCVTNCCTENNYFVG